MKKAAIDLDRGARDQAVAIKENIEILTGRRGGAIATTKGILTPSVGLAVNTAAATLVTLKTEFDQMVLRIADLETVVRALIARLNTP